MGWQWSAGSGPDAAPYFRVFNPETQAEKFDGTAATAANGWRNCPVGPAQDALSYFDAIPRSWGMAAERCLPVQAGGGRGHGAKAGAGGL
jgi:deoxyribodipyrimidine photo-lyase